LDSFDDRYLGSKTSDPTVDNDGNALVTGALYYSSTEGAMKVYDGANWITATAAGSTSMLVYKYVATAGQTTFSGAASVGGTMSYTSGNIIVFLNGAALDSTDYTATSGTSVVLGSAAALNDELVVVAFKSFTVADTYTQSAADAKFLTIANPSYTGTLTGGTGVVNLGSGQFYMDESGNVGIGTSTPDAFNGSGLQISRTGANSTLTLTRTDGTSSDIRSGNAALTFSVDPQNAVADSFLQFSVDNIERARIDSDGVFVVGGTSYTGDASSGAGGGFGSSSNAGVCWAAVAASSAAIFNRQTDDGTVVLIRQAGTTEGTISVSGTTVSYNGGHLARWAQTLTPKDESLVKGTVLSNLDEMNVYTDAEGNPVDNEQLNKVKVSDVEGDANVAGVFVNWEHDEQHNVDEINMAMTGDMIIRIAQGVTVQRGDLLMSAGDGTAKPQGDDIVRAKTIAKVTSTHVTCTYEDGSYCVPCVLMAC
jgi:hypothetical protein